MAAATQENGYLDRFQTYLVMSASQRPFDSNGQTVPAEADASPAEEDFRA